MSVTLRDNSARVSRDITVPGPVESDRPDRPSHRVKGRDYEQNVWTYYHARRAAAGRFWLSDEALHVLPPEWVPPHQVEHRLAMRRVTIHSRGIVKPNAFTLEDKIVAQLKEYGPLTRNQIAADLDDDPRKITVILNRAKTHGRVALHTEKRGHSPLWVAK